MISSTFSISATPSDRRRLDAAIEMSATVHEHETRADGRPYLVHPLSVARRLCDAGHTDLRLLVLAVLHDVLESNPDCESAVQCQFGEEVVEGLRHLTVDTTQDASARKSKQLSAIANSPADIRLVKLADRLDNIDDIGITTPLGWTAEKKHRYLDHTLSMMPAFLDLASPLVVSLIVTLNANPLLTDVQRAWLARVV